MPSYKAMCSTGNLFEGTVIYVGTFYDREQALAAALKEYNDNPHATDYWVETLYPEK